MRDPDYKEKYACILTYTVLQLELSLKNNSYVEQKELRSPSIIDTFSRYQKEMSVFHFHF